MAVVYRATGAAVQTAGATSLAPAVPSDAKVGDLLVLGLNVSTTTAQTFSAPAGWTLQSHASGSSGPNVAVFTKTAASGDPGATVTVSWGTSSAAAAAIMAYNGADVVSLVEGTVQGAVASGTTTLQYGTLQVPLNHMVVAISGATAASVGINTAPNGFDLQVNTSTNSHLGMAHRAYTAGSTGAVTATMNASMTGRGLMIALRAAQTPVFRASLDQTSSGAQGTSAGVNQPSSTQVGDLLVQKWIWTNGNPGTVTPPAGWTQRIAPTETGGIYHAVFTRIAATAGGASATFSWTGSVAYEMVVAAYSGAADVDVVGAFSAASTFTAPSITTLSNNDVLLYIYQGGASANGAIPGMTLRRTGGVYGYFLTLADEQVGPATVTGTRTGSGGTAGTADRAVLLALKPAGGQPKIRSQRHTGTAAAASHAVNMPPNIVAGDLLVVSASPVATGITATAPAGWTLIEANTSSSISLNAWTRTATGTEGATQTWTTTGNQTIGWTATAMVGSGNAHVDGSQFTATSATINFPTLTTTVTPTLLLMDSHHHGGLAYTPPIGSVETLEFNNGNGFAASSYEMRSVTGATGARTGTQASTSNNIGFVVAITGPPPTITLNTPANAAVINSANPTLTALVSDSSTGDSVAATFQVWNQAPVDSQAPTTVDTSTTSTATAYSNQRKVDRTQNGNLWTVHDATGANAEFHYSTNNGSTWAEDTGADIANWVNGSLFIDLDDYAHVAYKNSADGFIYYRRGTPNAGRTAWTWSAATTVISSTSYDYPDIVAHREGTGWKAHVALSYADGAGNTARYSRIGVTSGGTVTLEQAPNTGDGILSANYAVANTHLWPSIDFNHTGDGKTIAGSTPHLYAAWSAGSTGAGKGIRFRKATYSAGSWTWGTEREIDSTRYVPNDALAWLTCLFDGTRVIMPAFLHDGTGYRDGMLYERDAADTTTTTRSLLADAVDAERLLRGSASYDGDSNVYLFGRNVDETAGNYDLVYRKWTRSTTTLGAEVIIDAGVGEPYVSAKRGYSSSRIDFIYTDGTASPHNVVYGSIAASDPVWTGTTAAQNTPLTNATFSATVSTALSDATTYHWRAKAVDGGGTGSDSGYTAARTFNVVLNATPNAPPLVAPANASTAAIQNGYTFDWTFSDPDVGNTQSAYYFRRKVSGAPSYEYWNASTAAWQSTELKNASTVSEVTFAAGKWLSGTVYNWSVATEDDLGSKGPYATDFTVTAGTAPTVTVTAPSGSITATTRPTVTWSYSDAENDVQTAYHVQVESGAFGTTPGSGTTVANSTEVVDATGSVRSWTLNVDLNNGITYRFFVRSKQTGSQYSSWAYSDATTALDPPAAPAVTATADTTNAEVDLVIQGRDNMLTVNQASVETDTTGFFTRSNVSIARSTAQALKGSASLAMTSVAAGQMTARAGSGAGGSSPPVVAGTTYTAVASFRAATTGRASRVRISWRNAAGTELSISTGASTTSTTTGWTQATVTATAPATAEWANVEFDVLATGAAGEVHYVDAISLAPGSSITWTRGGLVGTTRFRVDYSDDGTTWKVLRDGSSLTPSATQQASISDKEAPFHKQRQYRAVTSAEV